MFVWELCHYCCIELCGRHRRAVHNPALCLFEIYSTLARTRLADPGTRLNATDSTHPPTRGNVRTCENALLRVHKHFYRRALQDYCRYHMLRSTCYRNRNIPTTVVPPPHTQPHPSPPPTREQQNIVCLHNNFERSTRCPRLYATALPSGSAAWGRCATSRARRG